MKKEMKLEEAMKKLEEITEKMQNESLSVEESLKLFEEGSNLADYCNKKITEAAIKISELSEKDGND